MVVFFGPQQTINFLCFCRLLLLCSLCGFGTFIGRHSEGTECFHFSLIFDQLFFWDGIVFMIFFYIKFLQNHKASDFDEMEAWLAANVCVL